MLKMWGRSTKSRLAGAVFVALCLATGCGGRSARHFPADAAGSGGSAETGGKGGGAGTLALTGGASGAPGGSAGMGGVLRPCGVAPLSVELQPPVVIVLEASEVMAGAAPSGGTHFDTARLVTKALLGTLRDGTRAGLAVATDGGRRGACSDPSFLIAPRPLDAAHRRAMDAVLDDAVPGGGSALLGTYSAVLDLLEPPEESPSLASVIVVGSGATSLGVACGVPASDWLVPELAAKAAAAWAFGTDTFAVGVAGTMQERRILSALAIAGGTAPSSCAPENPSSCYFDLWDGSDVRLGLERALRETAVLSPSVCRFELASIPSERPLDEPDFLNFRLRSNESFALLERVEPGPCSRGWQLSEDGSSVILCAETCGVFRTDPNATLEIALACDGVPPRN